MAELPELSNDTPAPKLDTKEKLLDYYFSDLLARGVELRSVLVQRIFSAWRKCAIALLSPSWVESLGATPAGAAPAQPKFEYDIVEHRDDPVSVVVCRRDYYKTHWLFELSDEVDGWRINSVQRRFVATRVRDGAEVETLREVVNIWAVATDNLPSAASLPIFLSE
jgi:hypothetical protein